MNEVSGGFFVAEKAASPPGVGMEMQPCFVSDHNRDFTAVDPKINYLP